MGRELDRRNFNITRLDDAREREIHSIASAVSDALPGAHRVRVTRLDDVTGNPAVIVSDSAEPVAANYVERAINHISGITRAVGLSEMQATEFTADPTALKTGSGAAAVHLRQRYKNIPIFQSSQTVRFAPSGRIEETVGTSVTIAEDIAVEPQISVKDAVVRAAVHVAEPQPDERGQKDQFGEPLEPPAADLTGFVPKVTATFTDSAEQQTVLEAGPFGDVIKASLIWFDLHDDLRLAWEVVITMPEDAGQYRTIVDAGTGDILYCKQLVRSVIARGNVFVLNGGGARQFVDFPRALADYSLPLPVNLPPGFPDEWVENDRTLGNSVNAHLGDSGSAVVGALSNGVRTFDAAADDDDDQKVINIFYLNCFMHDFFYLLGFREVDGNFQQNNFGRGGAGSDRVDARAHSGAVFGTANMMTLAEGARPIMNMGLVTRTNRHTAFDASVVFHEFTHGVTNRLVGGPLDDTALEADQSSGMGEGWSDFIACTITRSDVVGSWVVDDPSGFRKFPYNANFPDHFGKLGTGRFTSGNEHNIGEIWCAALMEMSRKIGSTLALQLVVGALKLTPANPSFLDGRDAILAELDNRLAAGQLSSSEHAAALGAVWEAFAKFGMGPQARSNRASLAGIVADFNPPATGPVSSVSAQSAPNAAIPDNRAVGISSVISIPQAGRLQRITVSVDIKHTFIGDLVVSLQSPVGTRVVLHQRAGGSQDNIVRSFTSESVPGLAGLAGQEVQGDWTLVVADMAGQDVGVLQKWGLEIGLEPAAQTLRGEAAPALSIPDAAPNGVTSTISIASPGIARRIIVEVDITHTFIGDLRVELESPAGTVAVLHNRAGGNRDNLIATFDSAAGTALATLLGQSAQGDWNLRVEDLAAVDTGKLNRWSIRIDL